MRDYRIHSSAEKTIITGGSAFNVKAESLRLDDFSKAEMIELYHEHTSTTGQVFTDKALDMAWLLSDGQPWLINALGYEVTWKIKELRDPVQKITESYMQAAGQNLITRRETHLDQLVSENMAWEKNVPIY